MKLFEFQNSEIAVFFAMLFYVCDPNVVFVSCTSTALRRFTWNNFFDKNGRTWPQFDLYNFWPWVTSGKFFRGCVELMRWEVLKISKLYSQPNLSYWRKTTRGAFGPPPSGRGLRFKLSGSVSSSWCETSCRYIPVYTYYLITVGITHCRYVSYC